MLASCRPDLPRFGIVVGHTAKASGGAGLASVGPSEYLWNKDLAEKIKTAGAAAGIEVGIFLRDGIGIAGTHRELADWGAAAAIELHCNNCDGSGRGTETLWGPAWLKSEVRATAIPAATNPPSVPERNSSIAGSACNSATSPPSSGATASSLPSSPMPAPTTTSVKVPSRWLSR